MRTCSQRNMQIELFKLDIKMMFPSIFTSGMGSGMHWVHCMMWCWQDGTKAGAGVVNLGLRLTSWTGNWIGWGQVRPNATPT